MDCILSCILMDCCPVPPCLMDCILSCILIDCYPLLHCLHIVLHPILHFYGLLPYSSWPSGLHPLLHFQNEENERISLFNQSLENERQQFQRQEDELRRKHREAIFQKVSLSYFYHLVCKNWRLCWGWGDWSACFFWSTTVPYFVSKCWNLEFTYCQIHSFYIVEKLQVLA